MAEKQTLLTGTVLDENTEITLRELCGACRVNADYILDMVAEGVVDPRGADPREWRFSGPALRRVQIALHLQRDLRVNLPGAALVIDLLEELEDLRRLRKVTSALVRHDS